MSASPSDPADDDARTPIPLRRRPPGRLARLASEVRAHPMAYGVLAAFVIAGPIVARFLFPEAPLGACAIGGVAFGAIAALAAVPDQFF